MSTGRRAIRNLVFLCIVGYMDLRDIRLLPEFCTIQVLGNDGGHQFFYCIYRHSRTDAPNYL